MLRYKIMDVKIISNIYHAKIKDNEGEDYSIIYHAKIQDSGGEDHQYYIPC